MAENGTEHNGYASKLEQRVVFFFVAIGVATLTLGVFALFDFLPEKPQDQENVNEAVAQNDAEITAETTKEEVSVTPENAMPISLVIDALDREVQVLNPESDAVEALDAALLSGVVRHPGSADFENTGTIFLLGHSSYLPTVMNKNFQAFNGIQKLEWGDTIRLRSGDMEYIYSVDRVYEAKASNAEVPLQYEEPKLVLVTCNSFGTKEDRFVVEASLVAKRALTTEESAS